jgi:hypothetical protein
VPGEAAGWDRTAKTATCSTCLSGSGELATERSAEPGAAAEVGQEPDRGEAGGSAAREWKRRHQRREARIRAQHRHVGGLILALSSDPRSTTAWATGARGEQLIGTNLDRFREDGIAVLHDRRIPGSRANIDHLVVSRAGVFVIDSKHYRGRVEQGDLGGWFKTDLRLYVGGRNRTKLIEAMTRQVDAVRAGLAAEGAWKDVPVTAAIVFMASENWSLFDLRPLRFGNVHVLRGEALGKLIRADGPLTATDVTEIEHALALALPTA